MSLGALKRIVPAALAALALVQPQLLLADQPSSSSTGAGVIILEQSSAPIELSQAQILASGDGNHLWIVYRNVSRNVVDRFAVALVWRNAAGRIVATLYKMVNAPIGPGESTTAELTGIGDLRNGARAYASVTRARFHDLALWIAPPPPPPAAANASAGQSLALRQPVTSVVQPIVVAPASRVPGTGVAGPTTAGPATANPSIGTNTVGSATNVVPTLAQGTAITITLDSDVSSAKSRNGDRVELRVAANVVAGGTVVIPAGSPGVGHVEGVRRAGLFGRSGSLTIVPDVVTTAAGALVPLQGATVVRPSTTAMAVIADLTIFGGLFARGREAVMSAGSVITATTASQIAAAPVP